MIEVQGIAKLVIFRQGRLEEQKNRKQERLGLRISRRADVG